jgi:hypothetical protein
MLKSLDKRSRRLNLFKSARCMCFRGGSKVLERATNVRKTWHFTEQNLLFTEPNSSLVSWQNHYYPWHTRLEPVCLSWESRLQIYTEWFLVTSIKYNNHVVLLELNQIVPINIWSQTLKKRDITTLLTRNSWCRRFSYTFKLTESIFNKFFKNYYSVLLKFIK